MTGWSRRVTVCINRFTHKLADVISKISRPSIFSVLCTHTGVTAQHTHNLTLYGPCAD